MIGSDTECRKTLRLLSILITLLASQVAIAQFKDIAWIKGGHSDALLCTAVSPDGKLLASGNADRTIKLWDVGTANLLATLHGHDGPITSITFIDGGKTLLSGSVDSTLRVWDVQSRQIVRTIDDSAAIAFVGYAPNGSKLITARMDGTIRVRDLIADTIIATITPYDASQITAFALSPDGKTIASGNEDNDTLKLWDAATGALLHRFAGYRFGVSSVAFSPDGQVVVAGGIIDSLKFWNVSSGQLQMAIIDSTLRTPWQLVFSSGGDSILAINRTYIDMWSMRDGKKLRSLSIPLPAVSTLLHDGHLILGGSVAVGDFVHFYQPFLEARDLDSGALVQTYIGHSRGVTSLAFISGDSLLFSCAGGLPGEHRMWDRAGMLQWSQDNGGSTSWINLSPDGNLGVEVVCGSDVACSISVRDYQKERWVSVLPLIDFVYAYVSPGARYVCMSRGKLWLWDSTTKLFTWLPFGAQFGQNSIVYSFDASHLAAIDTNGSSVLLLSMPAGTVERTLPSPAKLHALAFSRDDRYLASGSEDGSITIWETASGALVRTLTGHRGKVNELTFSRNGRFLVSASSDSTVRTWNLADGSNDYTYDEYPSAQSSVAVSDDAKYIASGTSDGSLILWNARGAIADVGQVKVEPKNDLALRVYPSPVRSNATVEFMLSQAEFVKVTIHTADGREVAMLADERMEAGTKRIEWDANDLRSGIYICRVQAGATVSTERVVLIR